MGLALKPKLYLDVDGVLNACPPIPGEPVVRVKNFPICIPSGTKERIARLVEVFEPVWCTTWRKEAHPHFSEALELGEDPWDHIEFNTYKLLGILEDAVEQKFSGTILCPWVWIDDDAKWELEELGLHCDKTRTLAINPNTAQGLTDEHVEEALAFAARLRGES